MNRFPFLIGWLGLMAVGWLTACEPVPCADTPPVALLGPFRSQQAPERVKALADSLGWPPPEPQGSAPYRQLRYAPVDHLGISGRVELAFFQEQLFEARFFPEDAAAYGPRIDSLIQRVLPRGGADLELTKIREQDGTRYALWRSRCLQAVYQGWVAELAQ
jgi:hypothetical protein